MSSHLYCLLFFRGSSCFVSLFCSSFKKKIIGLVIYIKQSKKKKEGAGSAELLTASLWSRPRHPSKKNCLLFPRSHPGPRSTSPQSTSWEERSVGVLGSLRNTVAGTCFQLGSLKPKTNKQNLF